MSIKEGQNQNEMPFNEVKSSETKTIIQNEVLNPEETEDLLNLRAIYEKWKQGSIEVKKYSIKQIIKFKSPTEVQMFNETFKDPKLEADSFKFDFTEELNSNDDYYLDFVFLVGRTTKLLDLSSFEPNLEEFYSYFNWTYLKDYLFGSLKPHALSQAQIEKFLLDKILFEQFPNLVILVLKEFKYQNIQHNWIFHTDEDRMAKFNLTHLPSLKSLYLTFEEKVVQISKEPLYYLSEEIMRISPNLNKIKLNFEDKFPAESTLVQILMAIAKFNLKIDYLSISTNKENLFESPNGVNGLDPATFESMSIKHLSFTDAELDFDFHKNRLNLINSLLPVAKTIENFSHTSIKTPNFDKIAPTDVEFRWIFTTMMPSHFENLKTLKLMIQFPPYHAVAVFNKLGEGSPLIENLTTSTVTLSSEGLNPWKKLKKVFFNSINIGWDSVEKFEIFEKFIRTLAPSLEDLKVHFECGASQSLKGLVLAYPYFVWMGFNWKLDEFQVTVNNRLKWTKGTPEGKLGIESPTLLSNQDGNFTSREIASYDLSLILTFDFFMSAEPETFSDFLTWLSATFPKRTSFNALVQTYMKNIEDFKTLFTLN